MKKIISVLVAGVCAVACAFSLVACGEESGHTSHNWSASYTEDGDRHYQTCDGCSEKKYSDHDYSAGGTCVCGKEEPEAPHGHNWSTTYTEDGDRHYQTCDGCDEKKYSDHDYRTGSSATCVCGKQAPVTTVAVTGVTLDKTELTLEVDGTATLTATVAPENATDKSVTYSVEPAGVVTVDNDGVVTAVAAGTATITVTAANNKTATCTVTVNAPITNAQVIAALDTYCKEKITKAGVPTIFEYNKNNVSSSGGWYIKKDTNGNITNAEYEFNYSLSLESAYCIVAKANFNTPISARDIIEGNLGTVTYKFEYRVNYNPTIQETRSQLCNAICNTVFESNGTVIARYIVDNGAAASDPTLSGTVRMFTVIEVTDKGVQQANVNIKTSSDDAAYIAHLSNANDYRVFDKVSYTIIGTKLANNNEKF